MHFLKNAESDFPPLVYELTRLSSRRWIRVVHGHCYSSTAFLNSYDYRGCTAGNGVIGC